MPGSTTVSWLVVIDVLLRVLIAARVIMSARPVPASLAWLIVLLLPVPFVPIGAYVLVGENRLGVRRRARYQLLTREFSQRAQIFLRALSQEWDSDTAPYRRLADVITQVGEIPTLRGNAIEFVAGSEKFIEGLIRDIDGAQERVHLLFYIWMESSAGEDVVRAVERAAARGLACRVIVDARGSKRFVRKGLPSRLRAGGAKVAIALPVNPFRALFTRLDLRNHRKIAVIDGALAWSGSANITDSTFGYRPVRRVGPWIDAMARVRGPAAQALDAVFLRDWLVETTEEDRREVENLLKMPPMIEEGCAIQIVPTGPDSGPASMRDAIITAIFAAREELIITTPYFVPDEATKHALMSTAMRGVAVTLIVPRHLDQLIVGAASRSHFEDLLRAGVRIHLHRHGLLHSKTMTIDSDVAMIGSHNLDERSFRLNYEVSMFIYDTDQASVLRTLQVRYRDESDEIFADHWGRRPLVRRFAENSARLLGPLL
jgi:cardiolipin synthase